jgi:hypothetical protein
MTWSRYISTKTPSDECIKEIIGDDEYKWQHELRSALGQLQPQREPSALRIPPTASDLTPHLLVVAIHLGRIHCMPNRCGPVCIVSPIDLAHTTMSPIDLVCRSRKPHRFGPWNVQPHRCGTYFRAAPPIWD